MKAPFIVAEMSANHLGSLYRAHELVEMAAAVGANAIKLQTWQKDTMVGDPSYVVPSGPWAGRNLKELYAEAYTPWEWHAELYKQAQSFGMVAFSSVFDLPSLEFLEGLNCPQYKISSFEITDHRLISACAATGKPLIISTGAGASLREVTAAVACAQRNGCADLTLLVCTSEYPTPLEQANVGRIGMLKQSFYSGAGGPSIGVGLSDHTLGFAAAAAATAQGATMIEKHLTLRRADGGPDAGFSAEPGEFELLVEVVGKVAQAIGNPGFPPETNGHPLRRSMWWSRNRSAGDAASFADMVSARPTLGLHHAEAAQLSAKRNLTKDVKAGTPVLREQFD